jgi:hypothetical protein
MGDRLDAENTERTLRRQSATLRRLIDEAQRVQREVTDHLAKLSGANVSKPPVARRKKPR